MAKQNQPYFELGELFFVDFFSLLILNSAYAGPRQDFVRKWCVGTFEALFTHKVFPYQQAQSIATFAPKWVHPQIRRMHLVSLNVVHCPLQLKLPRPASLSWLWSLDKSRMQIVVSPSNQSKSPAHLCLSFLHVIHEIGHLTDPGWSLDSEVPSKNPGLIPASNQADEDCADSFANGFAFRFNDAVAGMSVGKFTSF